MNLDNLFEKKANDLFKEKTIKLKIILLIVKKHDLSSLLDMLCLCLEVFPAQAYYLLDATIEKNLVYYDSEKMAYNLTTEGQNYLKYFNLLDFDIDEAFFTDKENEFINESIYNNLN